MPRHHCSALLAFLLCSAPSYGASATSQELVKAARARVEACPKLPIDDGVCPEALRIVEGYAAELKNAEDCLAKRCPAGDVLAIFMRAEKWDEGGRALAASPRSIGPKSDFIKLSFQLSRRAGAALAAADPSAKPPDRDDPAADDREVEAACGEAPKYCAEARGILAITRDVARKVAACEAKPCPFDKLDAAAAQSENAKHGFDNISATKTWLPGTFGLLKNSEARLAMILAKDAAGSLAKLSGGVRSFRGGVDGFSKGAGDAGALEAQAVRLSALYREASLGQDRNDFFGNGSGGDPARAALNQAAADLASARSRLVALETARGLKPFSSADGAISAGTAAAGRRAAGAKISPAAAPVHLDRSTIPPPVNLHGSAPPILAKAPDLVGMVADFFSPDSSVRADSARRTGLTYTVGDPKGRAALVHHQAYGDTCAIVAQEEVLLAYHRLPPGDPIKQETALRLEAWNRGFYGQGTPNAYTAEILMDRGLIVLKQKNASLAALDAAVRRGGFVIADVDARFLWNQKSPTDLGHAILITGAEVGVLGDATVGYYINDSGTNPPGRGRFVPIEAFQKAWSHHTRTFAEIR